MMGHHFLALFALGCAQPKGATDTSAPLNTTGTVRFVALGDAGEGNEAQFAVAEAIASVCASKGCDFALYLGDNFYNDGVLDIDDPQFQDKFEVPYAALDFPFYVVLGNHDYGDILGNMFDRPDAQVEYTDHSEKWVLPDRYHSHESAHVAFFALDTNAIMWDSLWGGATDQLQWLQDGLAATRAGWRIAYGHHPYISNGDHGIAGQYEGIEDLIVVSGNEIKDFVEAGICGEMDLYLCAHDHDMQWLEPTCGTSFVVSGAGAKNRELGNWGQPTRFETDQTPGFLWVEIVDSTLTGTFYDMNGSVLYTDQITR